LPALQFALEVAARMNEDSSERGLAVPLTMCRACGLSGQHADVLKDCVPALRDRIADLEFQTRRSPPSPHIERSRRLDARLPVKSISPNGCAK
jgi:hypothetical protein